jgi:hypothetical protein|nr:MAG TPA: Cell wall hydrolase autolysin [Caudoviricetes sp.]
MKKVALIIGHNKRSKGAFSMIVGDEFGYWRNIAYKIKSTIPEMIDIYEREPNTNYVREMNKLLVELNKHNYEYCLELHFNSALDSKANGCECLIYKGNKKAKELSTNFMARLQNVFNSKVRGVIEMADSKTRGGYGICNSKDTYVLLEPFFGSNVDESLKFSVIKDVVEVFVNFIKEV